MEVTPVARAHHDAFLQSNVTYPENHFPAFQRWGNIVQRFPQLAHRCLIEPMHDVYAEAMTRATDGAAWYGYDLAVLKQRYMMGLFASGLIPTHVWEFERNDSILWQQRLLEHHNATEMTRRNRTRIRKGKAPEIVGPAKFLH